jgi:spore coat protein CotH
MSIAAPMYRIPIVALVLLFQGPAYGKTAHDLFDPAVLHRIDLRLGEGVWETLKERYQLDDYYRADLRWNGITVRNVGIRSRGLGSRKPSKPGLRVDVDRYADGQMFVGLTSVVLDNLAQDASGIRERLAMRFYERMGLPAPREAHARVFVNGEYAGLYAIVESIDQRFLTRAFRAPTGSIDNEGYLFEYEYESAWNFDYLGPDVEAYAPLFDPVTHEDAPRAALYGPIEAMIRAINQTPDEAFVRTVGEYLDLMLFMKHAAVQAFIAEWDGVLGYAGVNNFYLYRFANASRSQFIAWDDDNAFKAPDFTIRQSHGENVLMRRAMEVPELRAAYFDALLASAAAATRDGWLEAEVQAQQRLISESMRADDKKPFTNEEFETGMRELADFARRRAGIVGCEVARMKAPGSAATVCGSGEER